ncbi:MAG: T9SS type A sorting domain-containing protein, partial [Raineya sp.]
MRISGIRQENGRLVISQIALDGFIESDVIGEDVEFLATNLAIQQLRADTQSDIVVLFTAGNYGGVFGRVRNIGPIFQDAYAIVQARFAIGRLRVFAHEVGHLFGARHQRPYDTEGPYQHGYTLGTGFLNARRHRTILCTGVNNHIEHYSNPNISYRGKPTGNNRANNARWINERGCVVANFFPNNEPANIGVRILTNPISGLYCNCNGSTITVSASVTSTCALTPFTYRWISSIDGINWINLPYTTPSFSTSWCQSNANGVLFRCIVTDSNGAIGTATEMMLFSNNCEPGTRQLESSLFPNPANENFQIELSLAQAEQVTINLVNLLSKEKFLLKTIFLASGSHNLSFSTQGYKNGMYVLPINGATATTYHHLIISKQ